MLKHLTLLGDSIFDNKSYVPVGNSVHEHLLERLTLPDTASLIAVDGAVINSVFLQLERIPKPTTHLFLSVGGNDALYLQSSVMNTSSTNVRDALSKMKGALQRFEREYAHLIQELLSLNLPLTICTIYDGVPDLDDASLAGVAIINDLITRTAMKHRCNLIDLRVLCNETTDYSETSPIEPSHAGGAKIAAAILQTLAANSGYTKVFC
jgi:hypothetical protein